MTGQKNLVQNLFSRKGACVTLITLICYTIYGLVFRYFDYVIFLFLLAAAALSFLYKEGKPVIRDAFHLIAAGLLAYSTGLFFLNSFPVWADNITHIKMYGSRGGLVPVIIITVLLLIADIFEIVSCFQDRKESKDA